jgi:hypothetical protein
MDYAETQSEVLDLNAACVCGHSRLGKTALLTSATDTRFRFAYSNDSGCSGASITRGKQGERVKNITTVFPFEGDDTKYFLTTKQMCMPCRGKYTVGDYTYEFGGDNSFCTMDWGRVNTPHRMVWYWGIGNKFINDSDGKEHLFGFEITWAIGDESNATETCIFYDGKVHKIGAVDVEKFPKGRFTETWKFISEDGRFNMTMKPTLDNHSDTDFKVGRMNCHQVYGIWNGDVTLDDGTKLEIKDLFAFCEYVENRW